MRTIPHAPARGSSDERLAHRLFDLALDGDTGSAELNAIDAEVYARLLAAYAPDPDDLRDRRARVERPESNLRISRTWGSATAARIPPLPWAP